MGRALFYLASLLVSALLGAAAGLYFRTPNKKLLEILYSHKSEWRSKIVLEYNRIDQPYTSFELFSFNWATALGVLLLALFVFLFLFDKRFRKFLYVKFTFQEERSLNQY